MVDQSTLLLRRSARHGEHDAPDWHDKPDQRDTHDEPPAASACSFRHLDPVAHFTLRTCIAGGRSGAVWLDRRQRRRRDPRGLFLARRSPSVHNESGQSRETVTDSTGAYRFTAVQPGTYTVTVKLDGFRTFTRQDVAGHAEQRRPRRRAAAGGPAQRVGDGVGRTPAAADRPRRGAIRAEVERTRESAGVDQPELPVPVPRAPGLHAAGGGALGAVESVARARVQRQRREPQLEQHPHRRRQHDQHLAAARRRLRACARIARNRQRRHQQLRRGAGAGRRLGHQRADQERHEQRSTDRRSSTTRTSSCGRRTTSRRPARRKETGSTTSTAARWAARSSATSFFYFGSYEGTRDRQDADPHAVGADRSAAPRRPVSVSTTPIYDPFTGNAERLGPHGVCGNNIPADRIDPTARQLLALLPLPNLAHHGRNEQLLRAGAVRAEPLDARHQGQLDRQREAEPLRAVQRARLLHGERDQLRQGAAGTAARQQQSRHRKREHLQRLGWRDLHDQADARDGRARRLRPHEQRRRAVGYRGEQGAGFPRPARHERPERL